MEESKKGPGTEDPPAVTGAEEWDQEPAVDAPEGSPGPDQTAELSTPEPSVESVKGLLEAYQEVLDAIEELPAVVWVPWDLKGPGSYVKVPYLRWFLAYFVEYHIGRSLGALDRRLNAIAALSDDPDANWPKREMVKLYLQSLPKPPYSVLIFAAVLAALVIALPLHAFGNVFYVLDLVGAVLRFNVGYLGRALEGDHLGPTVRSVIVLLVGLTVVAAVLTSPFGLKRMLFNLHPRSRERLDSTAAKSQGYRAEGLYALEEGVFGEAGIRRPKEGRWDLVFQTFLLSLLLVFGLCMAGLTLVILMSWNIHINADTGSSADVHFSLPEVSWVYYAVFSALLFAAFYLLLRRLVAAWKKRR